MLRERERDRLRIEVDIADKADRNEIQPLKETLNELLLLSSAYEIVLMLGVEGEEVVEIEEVEAIDTVLIDRHHHLLTAWRDNKTPA